MTQTTREALARIEQLLATPAQWTQGTMARNEGGFVVEPQSVVACSYCLLGAKIKVGVNPAEVGDRLKLSIRTLFPTRADHRNTITSFNDDPLTTHEDVLAVLHHAQENAR